jgi:hypothetical protein
MSTAVAMVSAGRAGAGEAAHPHAVGPQQMVQRRMDRAEKGAAVLAAGCVIQSISGAVE